MSNNIHEHCSKCFDLINCVFKQCDLISCVNKCGFKYHACKSNDHLKYICQNQHVECINECNGCRLKIKRSDLGSHLVHCVASVIKCSSYRVRHLFNKEQQFDHLKWPCPIESEKNFHAANKKTEEEEEDNFHNKKSININAILLEQDYKSLYKFSADNPIRFHRLYGYLIGLDLGIDYSNTRFSFMANLLRNVKSKIFKVNKTFFLGK